MQIKKNIKAPCHWHLIGESSGNRWIPFTKGQWHGKWRHHVLQTIFAYMTGMSWFAFIVPRQHCQIQGPGDLLAQNLYLNQCWVIPLGNKCVENLSTHWHLWVVTVIWNYQFPPKSVIKVIVEIYCYIFWSEFQRLLLTIIVASYNRSMLSEK